MTNLPSQCPSCTSPLTVTHLACTSCRTQLEGEFSVPPLLRLGGDDLQFVLQFVLASGSLKGMARHEGQSYPTIRNRLDDIITRLKASMEKPQEDTHDILDAVAQGFISVAEAIERLKGSEK